MISDEIWVRLDPGAGMVADIRYGRWFLAGIAAVLVAVVWLSGAISPRLSAEGDTGKISVLKDEIGRPQGIEVAIGQTLVNDGWLPVTITGVGMRAAGDFSLRSAKLEAGGGFPRTIPPGESTGITLILSAGDCEVVKEAALPVVLEVERWWGRSTAEVMPADSDMAWFSSGCE